MSHFYLWAIGLVVLALLFVSYPIFKQRRREKLANPNDKDLILSNANVVKQRITELEQEVTDGLIDESEKEAAIRDLKLALVDEMPTTEKAESKVNVPVLLLLALPGVLIGVWVYWQANQLSGLKEYKSSQMEIVDLRKKLEEQGPQSLTPNDLAKFALSIRSNLRENPDDVQGWSYLAMVNTSIGRVEEGIAAYKKALDLTPQDDNLRFKFAESLMLQGTEESLNNAKRQLDYLIRRQPDSRNNRLLLTSVAIQLQDAPLAVSQFRLIKDQMNPSSEFYQAIVNELRKLGVSDANIVGATSSVNDAENVSGSSIDIQVNITDSLGSSVPQNAYLIVFAQLNDGSNRAPLAVKRMDLTSLPVNITLSDNDAMIPALNLSSVEVIKLTARISLDEDVMPSEGELQGQVTDIVLKESQNKRINIVIDTKI